MPLDERETFLDEKFNGDNELRTEVEKMLTFADEETLADEPLENNAFELLTKNDDSKRKQIGDYKIIKELGEGGMGTVYEAIRETTDFKQKVALKVIKLGMDRDIFLSRFQHERKILATLQHPNIAGFIDGGMTEEGLPFYAMEFIEGSDIDEYCQEKNLGIKERLEIFLQVCDAVQYAHQNFIAHRDLKPNNILIKDGGTVKLLDFGIAKVLTDENATTPQKGTVTEFGMMTPAYASPEQVSGETVGVQSDIYSLGVILYELMTGQNPFNFKGLRADEAIKMICESDPVKPSSVKTAPQFDEETKVDDLSTAQQMETTLVDESPKPRKINLKSLKGDLDNIILKALKKTPDRRYASVQEFSDDIRRHLDGLPVSARPDTFSYRASKFIKRNKVGVIATSLVFLALLTGLFATLYQYRIAQAEKERAEQRFEQVRKLANNVVFKYHDAIADLPGSTKAREMLVKDAVEYLDNLAENAEDNLELQHELAKAYSKVGRIQGATYTANIGDTSSALNSYEKSKALFSNLVEKSPENTVYWNDFYNTVFEITFIHKRQNNWKKAEEESQQLLNISQKLIELEPQNSTFISRKAQSLYTQGDMLEFFDGYRESLKNYFRAFKLLEELYSQKEKSEHLRQNYIVVNQRIGTMSEKLATMLEEINDENKEINELYRQSVRHQKIAYEESVKLREDFPKQSFYNLFVAESEINYGTSLARIGEFEKGVGLINNGCEYHRKIISVDKENLEAKRNYADCFQYLAWAYDAAEKPNQAIESNRKSIKILEEITVKDPTNFEFLSQAHLTFNNTGDIFLKEGKLFEALDFYKRGIEYVEKMSKLNDNSQIKLLRSDSNRKIGNAYLAVFEKTKNQENAQLAENYLRKSQKGLNDLKTNNNLGKNDEHKLDLIDKTLRKISSE